MICIGYIGVEAFDIILYIAKAVSILNYPVLIIDLSETGALTKTIYHGMDLDSRDNIVHYRNINYTRKVPDEKELVEQHDDCVIFVVYGFNNLKTYPIHLDFINVVVNPFPHDVDRVNNIIHNALLDNTNLKLIVRDVVTIDDVDRIRNGAISGINPSRIKYLYYDIDDYDNALKCQVSQTISFRKISSGIMKIILTEIGDILPNIKPSMIKRAVYKARKGDKCR